MIRLASIEIEGFRAYKEKIILDLDDRLVVCVGSIGSGKTSLLMAIEFALFGTTRDVKKRILRKEDLINDFSDKAFVGLSLKNGSKNIRIERLLERGKRLKTRVIYDKGELYDERADEYIKDLLGLSLEDFSRQIAVTHLDLQELIYGSPATRSTTIDRLLGIDMIEKIFRTLQFGRIEEYERTLKNEIGNIRYQLSLIQKEEYSSEGLREISSELEKIGEKKENLERILSELREEYMQLQKKEKAFRKMKEQETRLLSIIEHYKTSLKSLEGIESIPSVTIIYERIKHALVKILEELYLGKDKDEVANFSPEKGDLRKFLNFCRSKVDIISRERDRLVRELSELIAEREYKLRQLREYEKELGRLSLANEEFEMFQERLKELIEKYGDEDEIQRRISKLNIRIEKEKARGAEVECIISLQRKIMGASGNEGLVCPVCGTSNISLTNIKRSYEENIKKYTCISKERIEELVHERDKLEEILSDIRDIRNNIIIGNQNKVKFERLQEEYSELMKEIKELEDNIGVLENKVNRINVLLRSINKMLYQAEKREKVEDIKRKISEYEAKLSKVRSELTQLDFDEEYYKGLYKKITEVGSRLESLQSKAELLEERVQNYKENLKLMEELERKLKILRGKLEKIEILKERLNRIKNTFRALQIEIRKEMLENINHYMNMLFSKIYIFQDYDAIELRLKTTESMQYKRSIYELFAHRVDDDKWVQVSRKMSDGQKIVVALCLVAALSKLYNHNAGFLILDEPVPNVDGDTRKIIYEVLSKELNIEQILLATQHIESFESLSGGKVYQFSKVDNGIVIRE